jgi:hypothetical protein
VQTFSLFFCSKLKGRSRSSVSEEVALFPSDTADSSLTLMELHGKVGSKKKVPCCCAVVRWRVCGCIFATSQLSAVPQKVFSFSLLYPLVRMCLSVRRGRYLLKNSTFVCVCVFCPSTLFQSHRLIFSVSSAVTLLRCFCFFVVCFSPHLLSALIVDHLLCKVVSFSFSFRGFNSTFSKAAAVAAAAGVV